MLMLPSDLPRAVAACVLAACLLLSGCTTFDAPEDAATTAPASNAQNATAAPPRPHAYAFGQPALLSVQRTFGVGNAITVLGDACVNDAAATESYAKWRTENLVVLQQLTARLAEHYRINANADLPQLQRRVAQAMHLRTSMDLSRNSLSVACASLPETLALPHMNLARRYQMSLVEAQQPDFLRPRRRQPPAAIAPLPLPEPAMPAEAASAVPPAPPMPPTTDDSAHGTPEASPAAAPDAYPNPAGLNR